jgi:hypothetical protein
MRRNLLIGALFFYEIFSNQIAFGQSTIAMKNEILSVDMGQPGCAISVINYFDGHLASRMKMTAGYWTDTPPVPSTLGDFGIRFKCRVGGQFDDAAQTYGAQWDEEKRIWKPYDEDESDRELLYPVSRVYQLKTPNATGFLRTTDEVSGDEDKRVRFYSFCLFHEKAAICGKGQSMKLEEPKGNYLPAILRILRSVSFIDGSQAK